MYYQPSAHFCILHLDADGNKNADVVSSFRMDPVVCIPIRRNAFSFRLHRVDFFRLHSYAITMCGYNKSCSWNTSCPISGPEIGCTRGQKMYCISALRTGEGVDSNRNFDDGTTDDEYANPVAKWICQNCGNNAVASDQKFRCAGRHRTVQTADVEMLQRKMHEPTLACYTTT